MEEIKLNIKALAAMKKVSIVELARQSGINEKHLKYVMYRGGKLTMDDVIKLSKYTGVPIQNIEV